jgi:hypothetical protein
MSTGTMRGLPARLEGVLRRFEKWRRTCKTRARIPGPLWDSAVKMAVAYGLHRTAKTLSVNYYSLKKRVEKEVSAASESKVDAATTFVELTPSVVGGGCECLLELDDADGAKMRVHLKGIAAPDLAALSRSFWRGEA